MKPGRGTQVIRQWRLLQHLAVNRFATITSLSDHFGCSIKTVYRDIAVLEEAGFPVYRVTNADSSSPFVRLEREWLNLHAAPTSMRGRRAV